LELGVYLVKKRVRSIIGMRMDKKGVKLLKVKMEEKIRKMGKYWNMSEPTFSIQFLSL